MGPQAPTPTGYITVNEAAARLGVTPWDVRRLIDSGEVQALVLVDPASLDAVKEKS